MASATSVLQCQLPDSEENTNTDNLNENEYLPRFVEVLENDLLLSHIFQKLCPRGCEDLKTCRAVSHLWNDEAKTCLQRNYWQNRKFLHLSNEENLKRYVETYVGSPENTIFSCFKVEHERKPRRDRKSRKFQTDTMNQFFNQFGPIIKSLSFDCNCNQMTLQIWLSTMKSLEELRIWIPQDCFYNKFENISTLEAPELKLRLSYLCLTFGLVLYGQPVGPPFPVCNKVLELILSKVQVPSPGGKELKICLMQWQDIRSTIVALEKYKLIRNLKIFEVRNVQVGEMRALTEMGQQIQLEYFSIDPNILRGRGRFSITHEIYEFLSTQANNLEMLCWASTGYFKLPQTGMPNLKKLRLRCAQEDEDYESSDEEGEEENALLATIDPIYYKNLFPQLEELHLIYNVNLVYRDPEEFPWLEPQEPCTSLRKLRVKYPEMSLDTLILISPTFPFITSLSLWIELEDETETREFYETLWTDSNFVTNLQELFIEIIFVPSPPNHEFEFESLFSGVHEEIIKNVVDTQSYDDFEPLEFVRPSIRNLTNLKKFSLRDACRHVTRYSSSYFTDFSAFCLFGKMENLEYLHLDKGIQRLSQAGFNHLKNKCKLQTSQNVEDEVSEQSVSVDTRIEEVFRSGFTYKKVNDFQEVNLIDRTLPDDENEHISPPSPQYQPTDSQGIGR